MNITNTQNLPQSFVEMAKDDYKYKPKQYSVTSLLKGIRQVILERRHHDEIEQDVSDMIWLLFGTATHHILEQQQEGETEFKEERLAVEVGDYILSGRPDLYNAETKTVTDYKTASVWKMIFADYTDWKRQLLMYAYMLKRIGFEVENGEVVAMLKDHSKRDAKYKPDYPKYPVKTISFKFTQQDFDEIETFIFDRFEEIKTAETLSDDELPLCTPDERYNSGDKFAVMKKGRKSALRVLDSMDTAEQWMAANSGEYIEKRVGEDKKCADYCSCNMFCNYWQGKVGNDGKQS